MDTGGLNPEPFRSGTPHGFSRLTRSPEHPNPNCQPQWIVRSRCCSSVYLKVCREPSCPLVISSSLFSTPLCALGPVGSQTCVSKLLGACFALYRVLCPQCSLGITGQVDNIIYRGLLLLWVLLCFHSAQVKSVNTTIWECDVPAVNSKTRLTRFARKGFLLGSKSILQKCLIELLLFCKHAFV